MSLLFPLRARGVLPVFLLTEVRFQLYASYFGIYNTYLSQSQTWTEVDKFVTATSVNRLICIPDEVKAIWDPEITKHFKNQPFTSPPRDFMERNFDRDVVWVGQFCGKMLQMNQKDASEAFQSVLLANLSQNKVGLYSKMHDNAVIKYGYGNHEAIRLAYM